MARIVGGNMNGIYTKWNKKSGIIHGGRSLTEGYVAYEGKDQ